MTSEKFKRKPVLLAYPKRENAIEAFHPELHAILRENNHYKTSGKGNASFRTQELRGKALFKIFRTLRKDLSCGIEDPRNIKPKHIEKLVAHWIKKGLAPATIDNDLSILRIFCGWINKAGMVKSLSEYAPDVKRTYATLKDKSWAGNGVDPLALLGAVYQEDKHVGIQLLIGMAFGARRQEMVRFKPFIHTHNTVVEFCDGTKGGRPRIVEIETEFQRTALALAKQHILDRKGRPGEFIGHPDKTLKQNLSRHSYVLRKCGISKKAKGITGHGLRSEFAIDELAKYGLSVSVRGVSSQANTSFANELGYLLTSEKLGHSRKSVITAYSGPLKPTKAQLLEILNNAKKQNKQKSPDSPDSPENPDEPKKGEDS